jgi:hypothetical protein
MQIETTITEKVTKEVQLPFYFKSNCGSFIKIESEEVSIKVNPGEAPNYRSIALVPTWIAKDDAAKGSEVTEEEFTAAFNKTLKQLNHVAETVSTLKQVA